MRAVATALVVLAVAALAACGNDPAKPDSSVLVPSTRAREFKASSAGLTVSLPTNLAQQELDSPGLFFASLGRTVVSAYAYRRGEQLPRNKKELAAAQKRLVASTKKRDTTYKLVSAKATRVAKAPAIVLVGDQTIAGERIRIRSIHVYKGTIEYVIEVFAPATEFKTRDAAITPQLLRTLTVTGKFKRRGAKDAKKEPKAKTETTPAQP
jgi:hypothetical protein